MNPELLKDKIDALPYWYHRIELPGGIETPGWAPLKSEAYRIPDSLSGKRVLDVGAWDGYWTFEAIKRGAREVVAIDDFSDFLGCLEPGQRSAWDTFDLSREALGLSPERCDRKELSVYDICEENVGRFDTVFFFGTLYHLRYPLLALDKISAICDGDIFIESAICDDYSPYNGVFGQGYQGNQMVMEFYPNKEYGDNDSNWWAPTVHCMMHLVHAAGFTEKVEGWRLTENPRKLPHCRGFVSARKPG